MKVLPFVLLAVCVTSCSEGSVKHYHIKKTSTGHFYISEKFTFATLPELIVSYKQKSQGWLSCVVVLCLVLLMQSVE